MQSKAAGAIAEVNGCEVPVPSLTSQFVYDCPKWASLGYRAALLALHRAHVSDLRERVRGLWAGVVCTTSLYLPCLSVGGSKKGETASCARPEDRVNPNEVRSERGSIWLVCLAWSAQNYATKAFGSPQMHLTVLLHLRQTLS